MNSSCSDDSSMGSSATNSLFNLSTVTNEQMNSPTSPFSPLERTMRWKQAKSDPQNEEEFGSIAQTYDQPLIFKFYHPPSDPAKVVARIGDYEDVPVDEWLNCLGTQEELLSSNNVHIEIDVFEAKPIWEVKVAFDELLDKQPPRNTVARLVISLFDFKYADKFAPALKKHYGRLFELNVGIPNKRIKPQSPDFEAECVMELLHQLLKDPFEGSPRTLRVLRVFPFLCVGEDLARLINGCRNFKHLTLSNISSMKKGNFNKVHSILLDGCDMADTWHDKDYAKKMTILFPEAVYFGFTRCAFDVINTALKTFASDRIGEKRDSVHFYQSYPDFEKFLMVATSWFEKIGENRQEKTIELIGHEGGPRVVVHSCDSMYRVPLS
ncbi:unnamed protein product [Caenorhabditis auriculariae]|uniref:Uncharacterized protein n=1 Tax=Caenorhabditis auriculariae TaxID=2777116 RepID=A0A8S1GPK9_9PELO|nr:unnamed protein product [Caenorhabditis auriculariae]